jgi:hypothetical protein
VLGGLASQWTEVKHHVLLFTFHATRFLTNAEGCTRGRTLQDRARHGPGAAVLEQGCADCEVSMLARVGLPLEPGPGAVSTMAQRKFRYGIP